MRSKSYKPNPPPPQDAVDLPGFSGDSIAAYLKANSGNAFPIDFPKTFFAWDCMQSGSSWRIEV